MRVSKMAAWTAALTVTAGAGLAMAPRVGAQAVKVRTQSADRVQLFTGGSRIGVSIQDLEQGEGAAAKNAGNGVLVESVAEDSPAQKAGMLKGDIIVEFDGERVRSARQLTRLVQETPSGRSVQVAVLRGGQRTTMAVTPSQGERFRFEDLEDLAEWGRNLRYRIAPAPPAPPAPPARPSRPSRPAPPPPPPGWDFDGFFGGSTSRLGLTVQSLSPQLREYFGVKQGVLVASVRDDSVAAKAGLKPGDVITSVDGGDVEEPSDVRRRLQDVNDGQEFTIAVSRDRKALTLKGKMERTERRPAARTRL